MNCRRHGSKPTIALWMLVAVADLAILTAAGGAVATLLVLSGLVLLAGGFAARRLVATGGQTRERPAEAVVRRRA